MTQASGQLVCLYADLIGAVLPNISHPNRDIQAVAKEANAALLNLQPSAELPAKVCRGGGQLAGQAGIPGGLCV